jgi:uncharacterized Rossmann fold enzyme
VVFNIVSKYVHDMRYSLLLALLLLSASGASAAEEVLTPLWSMNLMPDIQVRFSVLDVGIADINNDGYGEVYAITRGMEATAYTTKENSISAFWKNGSKQWVYGVDGRIRDAHPFDVDNDRKTEFVVSSGETLNRIQRGMIRLVGSDGDLTRSFEMPVLDDFILTDMDRDSYIELVGGSEGRIFAYHLFGDPVWIYPTLGKGILNYSVNSVDAIDIERKGEFMGVVAGSDILYYLDPKGAIMGTIDLDPETTSLKKKITTVRAAKLTSSPYTDTLAVVGSRMLRAVRINRVYRYNGEAETYMHIENISVDWTTKLGCDIQDIELASLDSSEYDGIIVACSDSKIYGFSHNGGLLWDYPLDGEPTDVTVKDIDGDRLKDILVSTTGGQIYVLDLNGDFKWMFDAKTPLLKVTAGDLDGDGQMEIAAVSDKPAVMAFAMNQNFTIRRKADTLFRLGQEAFIQSRQKESLEYFKQAKLLYLRMDDGMGVTKSQTFITEIEKKLQEDRKKEADTLYSKAQEYYDLKDFANAKNLVEKAAAIYYELANNEGMVKSELLKLQIEKQLGAVNPTVTLPTPTTTTLPESLLFGLPSWVLGLIGAFLLLIVLGAYLNQKGGRRKGSAQSQDISPDEWGADLAQSNRTEQ